jgi:hypothetical protein
MDEHRAVAAKGVQTMTRSVIGKIADISATISRRYTELKGYVPPTSFLKSIPSPHEWRLRFNDDDNATMVDVARSLAAIAAADSDYGQDFLQLYQWAVGKKSDEVPTILDMFVIPIVAIGDNRDLPWTEHKTDVTDKFVSFATHARSAMAFMEREGCRFFVDLILRSYWVAPLLVLMQRSQRFVIAPEVSELIDIVQGAGIGFAYYYVPPPMPGLVEVLSDEALRWARLVDPSSKPDVVDRAYTFVYASLFGLELPFENVPLKQRNAVAASLAFDDRKNIDQTADLILRLCNDNMTRAAAQVAAPENVYEYVARNLLDMKYGSNTLDGFVDWFKRTLDPDFHLRIVAGDMWSVALKEAIKGNHLHMDEMLRLYGAKPPSSLIEFGLSGISGADRGKAVKQLLNYGIKVEHLAFSDAGDVSVARTLFRSGQLPSANVMANWSVEARTWYATKVARSQSVSDVVDNMMEPM